MRVVGYFQTIAGKPSVVGKPETWSTGFDDWTIPEGARITVEFTDEHVDAEEIPWIPPS